ncbi:unnamed protein product [Pedinophyceae sp. YPF-701]|nr:unnamed protein product [Pedinophyceae sp. YPF-701]
MEERRGPARTLELEDLCFGSGGGPLASIIAALGETDRVALAATSSGLMKAVLECSGDNVKWRSADEQAGKAVAERVHRAGCVSDAWLGRCERAGKWLTFRRARDSPDGEASVVAVAQARHLRIFESPDCVVPEPLTAPELEEFLPGDGDGVEDVPATAGMTGLRHVFVSGTNAWVKTDAWLPKEVRGGVERLVAPFSNLRRVPGDMASLGHLDLVGCNNLARSSWLPPTSRATLKVLWADRSSVRSVPPGLARLEDLSLSKINATGHAWLPPDSRATLRVLRLWHSKLTRLPPDLTALEELSLTSCEFADAAGDWLPQSSRASLRELELDFGPAMSAVPPDMPQLEHLSVTVGASGLAEDWLPPSSSERLKTLNITYTPQSGVQHDLVLRSLPALEELVFWLDVEADVHLWSASWLHESAARRLRKLDVGGTDILHLPAGLVALEELIISDCTCLYDDWDASLTESCRRKLRKLAASDSNIKRVPAGLTSLEEVELAHCKELEDYDWIDASSRAKVRTINAKASRIKRIPSGLKALENLDVARCHYLDLDWIDNSSRAAVRHLRANNSSVSMIPSGFKALRELSLRGCSDLDTRFIDASSSQELRRLCVAYARVRRIRRCPKLETLDLRGCNLEKKYIDEASCGRVTMLNISHSNVKYVPEQMRALRKVSAFECVLLVGEWYKKLPRGVVDVYGLWSGGAHRHQRFRNGRYVQDIPEAEDDFLAAPKVESNMYH